MKLTAILLLFVLSLYFVSKVKDSPPVGWKQVVLSDNWSMWVPSASQVIIRNSNSLRYPDEIRFPKDSLRLIFFESHNDFWENLSFGKLVSKLAEDPTLGMCQGSGDEPDESLEGPWHDFETGAAGWKGYSKWGGEWKAYGTRFNPDRSGNLDMSFDCVNPKHTPMIEQLLSTVRWTGRN